MGAQSAPGFTALVNEYYGCDPAVASAGAEGCPARTTNTSYVDPLIGTAKTTATTTSTLTTIMKTDGTQVQIFPELKAYFGLKLNVNPAMAAQSSANCTQPGATLLGTEKILGVETYKYRRGTVEPGKAESDGNDGTVTWLAPSLNCFTLRGEFHFQQSPTTFQIASNVALGKPPASAFAPPEGYVEMSPMEIQHKIFVINMQRANSTTSADQAEAAWTKSWSSNIGAQRMDAMWHKQHDAAQ